MIKYSLYSSAFNLIKNQFDYEYHIDNFCEFINSDGEVIVCCNKSEDNSLGVLKHLTKKYSNLKIIESNISYDFPGLDGQVKNTALSATKNPIKIHMDMDESWNLSQRDSVDSVCRYFLNSKYQAVMIPVINLYKDKNHYKDINQKWRIHKENVYRGVVNFARRPDGTHDINLSDGCEAIDKDGNLVSSAYLMDPTLSDDKKLWEIKKNNIPFVWHHGLLDLEVKAARNKNFWKEHWEVESGRSVEVELSPADFEKKNFEVKEHGLEF